MVSPGEPLRHGILTALAVLTACALNRLGAGDRTVQGTVVRITRLWRYEAPCGIQGRVQHTCDDPPVCCAYEVVIEDATGQRTYALTMWGRHAPGIALGRQVWVSLVRTRVPRLLECGRGPYGCGEDLWDVIPDDLHWGYRDAAPAP